MSTRFVMPTADVGTGISPPDGAKLFFTITGTNDDLDTFSDAALTTPNANPVIADSAGVFPDIFLGSGSVYRVTLKDKNNVQTGFGVADPVEGIAAADISYTNSGSGAIGTDVDTWMKSRTARAADFGDVTVDIGLAVNNAIAAGKTSILLPEGGPFPIVTGMVIPDGVDLLGPGIEACHLRVTGATVIGILSELNRHSIGGFTIDTAPSLAHTVNIVQNGSLSVVSERVAWHDIYINGGNKKSIGSGHNFEVIFGNTGSMHNFVSVDAADRCVSFSELTTDVNGWSFSGYLDFRGAINEPFFLAFSDAVDPRSHFGGPIQCQASGKPVVINSRNSNLTIYAENLASSDSETVSVVSISGIDYKCIAPHTSTTTIAKVVGTDGNDYDCIREHTSEAANKPITGSDSANYWVQNGSGSGATWLTATSYTTSNEPGVGGGYKNKWRKAATTGATAWGNSTSYTAGRRQIVLGDSAQGNQIFVTNGNRIVDTSKTQDNIIIDKDIGSGRTGFRSPVRIEGLDGFLEITSAGGGISGGLKIYHDADRHYRIAGIDTGSTQTIECLNEVGGDLDWSFNNITVDSITVNDAGPLRVLTGTVTDLASSASETILTLAVLGNGSNWEVTVKTATVTAERATSIVNVKSPTNTATSLDSNLLTITAAGTGDIQITNGSGITTSYKWTAIQKIV